MIKKFKDAKQLYTYIDTHIPGDFDIDDVLILSEYIKRLKPGDSYLEIGVKYGRSAAAAVFSAQEGVYLYLCDTQDIKAGEFNRLSRQDYFRLNKLDTKTIFLLEDSAQLGKKWDPRIKLDLIFIDGNHGYKAVKADILNWYPHLKSGGVMLFHDYEPIGGEVRRAVDELIKNSPKRFKDFIDGKLFGKGSSSMVGAVKI